MSSRTVARANFLLFGVFVAILLLVSSLTWEALDAVRAARIWSEHTWEVLGTLRNLEIGIRDAETGQRGYLLTGDEDYLTPYKDAMDRVTFLQGDLQRLTADSPRQQARLEQLSPLLQRKLEELAQTIELRRTQGLEAALQVVRTNVGRDLTRQMVGTLAAMTTDENALLARRLLNRDARAQWIRTLVAGGTATAVLGLLWAAWTLNRAWRSSARMEAEQRSLSQQLRASLDSLSQGVAVFDAERRLLHWNECFHVLLKCPASMLLPGTAYATLAAYVRDRFGNLLESDDQIEHGRAAAGESVVYSGSMGAGHELELRRTPMPDGGFVLTISDMTKRAQAEAVLREAQKMQAIGQLTGGIAHDFNNLLTVILGNLEFIRAKLNGEPALQLRIERATWAAQRGATLTGQLLAFARKQPLAPQPIDLPETLPDLVPLLRRTLGEHIDVRYVESAGLWPALADPAQLESAVLNLALNARDAMPSGGRLTIELANMVLDQDYAAQHAEVAAGDYTMLAVSDTGHGMTPDILARVFEPFFTTKPDGKGTGLGMAMVFGFVKQSGGHVKIYSEPEQGTTVRIYLPRALNKAAPVQRLRPPIELPRGTATVLLVEDEASVREIAVAILSDLGYRVLEAADGDEALRVFGTHMADIDLLLTDVVLPGKVRGRELAERVQAVRPSVGVLFMSGYTENSIVHHGRLDDGVQLLSKPFKRDDLARKVADVLAGAQPHAQEAGGNVVPMKQSNKT